MTRLHPALLPSTSLRQGHAERAAINTPIQGSAADVAASAMVAISKCPELKALGFTLLMQVWRCGGRTRCIPYTLGCGGESGLGSCAVLAWWCRGEAAAGAARGVLQPAWLAIAPPLPIVQEEHRPHGHRGPHLSTLPPPIPCAPTFCPRCTTK